MTTELNSDVTANTARALHRVVRAMHDGNCPSCGHLGTSQSFITGNLLNAQIGNYVSRYLCPVCDFTITAEQARAALEAFRPYMRANLEIFEKWRGGTLTEPPEAEVPKQPGEIARYTPDYRNNGQYQFVTGFSGSGAEMCAHLTLEVIEQRLRERYELPDGVLVDDGKDLIFIRPQICPTPTSSPPDKLPSSVELLPAP